MTVLVELTSLQRRRLEVPLDLEAVPRLADFLRGVASSGGWDRAASERLVLVGEETLTNLLSEGDENPGECGPRRLMVVARTVSGGVEMEFVAASEGENIEDMLAYLGRYAPRRAVRPGILVSPAAALRLVRAHGTLSVGSETAPDWQAFFLTPTSLVIPAPPPSFPAKSPPLRRRGGNPRDTGPCAA